MARTSARGRTSTSVATTLGPAGPGARGPVELAVEEPLEIRLGDELLATTMRTPGHDFELAVGWLWAEGHLSAAPADVRYCATGSAVDSGFNVVSVLPSVTTTAPEPSATRPAARLGLTTSSCGICGTEQLEALVARLDPLPPPPPELIGQLAAAGGAVAGHQPVFEATGGTHAAAVLDPLGVAEAVVRERHDAPVVREDVGRHNAVDKVVGRLLLDGRVPATAMVLWVSGRASFELVQKAWAAGFAALVAVGAPSELAVTTAARAGLVLAGFARDGRATLYNAPDSTSGGTSGAAPRRRVGSVAWRDGQRHRTPGSHPPAQGQA